VPLNLELRLSVEDSPNSAGETIDAIRCCKLARNNALAGPLEAVSAWTMKHPPVQYTDAKALQMLESFIAENAAKTDAGTYEPAPVRVETQRK
jgi:myo-inositol-1-phosphate synthase